MTTWDKTETLPRKVSLLEALSFSGDVGADVVLELGLPVISCPDWDKEVGIPDPGVPPSLGEVAALPLLSPL